MIVLGSSTAETGMQAAIDVISHGGSAIDAVESGLRLVEIAPDIHSVGQDAWPNLLGQHQLDASIMDGRTLDTGAVGALTGFTHPITVARQVMQQLPHVMLVGEGAARFADEVGAQRGDLMTDEVRQAWAEWVRNRTTEKEWANWPPEALAPWARMTADPETAHGTVCLLVRDGEGDIAAGVSTSGWAWKYPGRLGDSPIIGAGNYADNRYGAACCTGFGEMAIRASTARSVVLYLKCGMSLSKALEAAADDLDHLAWKYRGRVTVYALDRAEQHQVTTYSRSTDGSYAYQFWQDGMPAPEERQGAVITADQLD